MKASSKKDNLLYNEKNGLEAREELLSLAVNPNLKTFVDFLSAGQWVDPKKFGPQWRRLGCATPSDKDGSEFISRAVESGALIKSEHGSSVRMVADAVIGWRRFRGLTLSHVDQSCPRFFGGVLEDDIWMSSPLRTVSMVTLTCNQSHESKDIREIALPYGGLVLDDGGSGNIIRIMCASSRPLISLIKDKKMTKTIRSTEVRRRELVDIPECILEDMVSFYLVFTKSIIKGKLSLVLANIPREFIESQLYVWICDGIRRFDESAAVPFGAYLADRVKRWAYDLARSDLDSATAAQQNLAQKAQRIEGDLSEKADALGVSEEKLSSAMGTSRRIYAMGRGALRLDSDSDDLSPLHDRISAPHDDDDENSRISMFHRVILQEALRCSDPDASLVEVLNFFWGEEGRIGDSGMELIARMREDEGMKRFVTC